MSDLIDRQEAIDAMLAEVDDVDKPNVELRWWNMGLTRASEIVKQLPSAQPEIKPKEGRWSKSDDGYECSECEWYSLYDSPWCPWCGAKMEVLRDE